MKKKLSILCSLLLALQMILSTMAVPAVAEGEDGDGTYTVPESVHETFNMNLDWKFYDVRDHGVDMQKDIWTVMSAADKNGKKFYEKDYDDSDWGSVSIPHGIGGGTNSFTSAVDDAGSGYRSVLLYRKTFTVPQSAQGGKIFFELEGIRQGAYVWVNGKEVGYYEAGITAMGFDLTNYVTPSEEAVIAILNDGMTARGTYDRIPYETVPGDKWGTSYSYNNYKGNGTGVGAAWQWNTKDFNEPQIGLIYDAYLHVTAKVYQTFPLYNNLKTTGNYIYASDFNIDEGKAKLNVKAEIRNESAADGNYTLEVAVVDHEGKAKYNFSSVNTEVKKASDAGVVYQTAAESDVYSAEKIANPVGFTDVNTPDVTYIEAAYDAENVRFWSLEDPYLYTVYTILKDASGKVVDVQSKKTGFRKVVYEENKGVMINDSSVWMRGYAQRATNEWAVIGSATDWLQDWDMALLKENNANFIRWMHVAPKPAQVRSSDKYGVAIVCPAGDKEKTPVGREYSQRAEAMRDAMIYYRNSPSVLFWETGNSPVTAAQSQELAQIRDKVDPYGMRFIGARSTTAADQLNYDYNWAGTMCSGPDPKNTMNTMKGNGKPGPIVETEYDREEAPRRVWDRYSPPDYDYVNKAETGVSKADGYDAHDLTQEEITLINVRDYANDFYTKRAGGGSGIYSAAAMMVWSDSNMHTRNTASENCRTSGRVDPVRQTKETFEGTKTAQSDTPDVHIVGHWSYPEYGDDTYNYFGYNLGDGHCDKGDFKYKIYDLTKKLKRDPRKKSVYVIGSKDVSKVELYRVDGTTETLIGTDNTADSTFVYQFDNIDVTQGDAVIARAYNVNEDKIAEDRIDRSGEAKELTLEVEMAPDGWKADGSDIAFFDVKVRDANGNVCVLNYDKITLKGEGNGVLLGGYNSGSGSGCFQNTQASQGFSNYFGGEKDGVSTIGKPYVFAENGTNRIFVRSTREAGDFKLTVSMDGAGTANMTITSKAVDVTGGLTKVMQSTKEPGVSAPPVKNKTNEMQPLMFAPKTLSWANAKKVVEVDENVYYTINVNGTPLDVTDAQRARLGTSKAVFGPIIPVLDAINYPYIYDEDKGELSFNKGDTEYSVKVGINAIYVNGQNFSEITQEPAIIGNTLFVSYQAVLGYTGASVQQDNDNKVVNITYTPAE